MQILYGKEFQEYYAGYNIVIDGKLGVVLFRIWRFIGVRWTKLNWEGSHKFIAW